MERSALSQVRPRPGPVAELGVGGSVAAVMRILDPGGPRAKNHLAGGFLRRGDRHDRANNLPLPDCREARRRRDGLGLL